MPEVVLCKRVGREIRFYLECASSGLYLQCQNSPDSIQMNMTIELEERDLLTTPGLMGSGYKAGDQNDKDEQRYDVSEGKVEVG